MHMNLGLHFIYTPACVYVHHIHSWFPVESPKGSQVSWNLSYRLLLTPCGCWDPNLVLRRKCS